MSEALQDLSLRSTSSTPDSDQRGPVTGVALSRRHRIKRSLLFLLCRPGLVLALAVLCFAVLMAVHPALFTSQDPLATNPTKALLPPGSEDHIIGTDAVGRDLWSRVVHGSASSLAAALLAAAISLVGGGLLGLLAGYTGGAVDAVLMRMVDVMLAFPALLLSMAIIAALGFGTLTVAIAVGVVGVAAMARLMRSEALRVRNLTFVEAAEVSGHRTPSILLRHVLPNAAGPALVLATLDFGTAILAISSLSFLGFGEPPPTPEWGALISYGRDYLASAWWLTAFPGLAIAAVVLATNHVSRSFDGGNR